jgi:hypothetical protein
MKLTGKELSERIFFWCALIACSAFVIKMIYDVIIKII